ncbi:type II toxin-antitoxin system RelE/ParE family toxin [Amphiplicatus metriothermophilus]|uniref:Plasmid stabilization system protein ParE n=1 Tax=Amphiplicatus metriothermophilus TaxID=1519374 RepID=A0A239PPP3_9PROT|nr:type II toxin-antitoxin system RelE/ParE family toxin [Amphiplicatus metriothermophilus]SNT72100.1 Plasmid stabilization system protein ParE [Amphiplicatus metriothermophilus]
MKVVVTDAAFDDLLRIGQAIAQDNPARAATFVEELQACCERLGHAPRAFPLLPGHEERGVRRRPYRDYMIFYRIEVDAVEILHVIHGARDYERILFPE